MTTLSDVAGLNRLLAKSSARTAKINALADLLRDTPPRDIETVVSYLAGRLRQGKIGLGYATVKKAAERKGATHPSLAIEDADQAFDRIRKATGSGSVAKRQEILGDLFANATAEERDFLLRLISGELRQGALEGVMTHALAKASGVPLPEIRRGLMVAADLPLVARITMAEGSQGLGRLRLMPLKPVAPMLAQTTQTVRDALERLGGEAVFEYKLDGARIQVHKSGKSVAVFTRRLNDVTEAVPELVEAVRETTPSSFILDGEALALGKNGRPLPFQVTMRRFGRRSEVERHRAKLPLSPFFFDCLMLEGDDLTDKKTWERFAALAGILPPSLLIPRLVTNDPVKAESFLEDALAHGHEGVMAKSPDAPYEAGGRGAGWLKLKRAHTLDLVVLAAEWGHGRRQGWLSNLHLGARAEDGGYVMIGKTFKGMTDQDLESQTRTLLDLQTSSDGHVVRVKPELVVEVAFGDVQMSPRYPAGVALRFARVKGYRHDKRPEDADSIKTVRALWAHDTEISA